MGMAEGWVPVRRMLEGRPWRGQASKVPVECPSLARHHLAVLEGLAQELARRHPQEQVQLRTFTT